MNLPMISIIVKVWDFFEVKIIGNLTVLLFAAGLGLAINEVFCRYVLHHSFAWSNELVTFTIVMAVLLNYGLTQRDNKHIRVTIFTSRLPHIWQEIALIFNDVMGIALSAAIIYHGLKLIFEVMRLKYATEVLRIPTCIGYSIFVFSFLLLAIRYLLNLYNSLVDLKGSSKMAIR